MCQKLFRSVSKYFSIGRFLIYEGVFGFDVACNYLRNANAHSLVAILRLRGATIGRCCDIQSGIVFHNCKNFHNFRLGDNSHIGKNCFIDCNRLANTTFQS